MTFPEETETEVPCAAVLLVSLHAKMEESYYFIYRFLQPEVYDLLVWYIMVIEKIFTNNTKILFYSLIII